MSKCDTRSEIWRTSATGHVCRDKWHTDIGESVLHCQSIDVSFMTAFQSWNQMGGWREVFIQGVHSPCVHSLYSGELFKKKNWECKWAASTVVISSASHSIFSLTSSLSLAGSTSAQFLSPLSELRICSTSVRRRAGQIPEGKAMSTKTRRSNQSRNGGCWIAWIRV